jgi:Putative zinc-finger
MSTWIAPGESTPPRNCRQVLRVLQSYLDGVLDDAAAGYVAGHLRGCRRCAREAETYEAIKDALARCGRSAPDTVRRLREFGESVQDEPGESGESAR